MSGKRLRIAVAGVYHETNTFAPGTTVLEDFKRDWTEGPEAFAARYAGTRTSMGGVLSKAEELGIEAVPGLYTYTTPSGLVERETMEALFDAILDSLAPDVDGVVLILHGAMAAEGYPDAEGELLRRLRERRGRALPTAVTVDLHANISEDMVRLADIIVGYDTYPHVDMFERAEEAVQLLADMIEGRVRPAGALARPGMLPIPQAMLTAEGAMKELMDEAFAMERRPGVLNVTVLGGFPYCDVPDAGMAFVVTTDGDPALAERLAARLADRAWERRERFAVELLGPDEAVRRAFAAPAGPVILAEGSDNVGGGAPADATHLLARLVDPPVRTLVVLRDAEAARKCHEIGVGGVFEGAVGGKSGDLHGRPVPIRGRIRLLSDGVYFHHGPYMTGQRADMGLTAVVECGKLTVVLTERRTAPWDVGHVASVGLRPETFHVIVVKSAIAWQAAFGPVMREVIHVDTPGCCTANLKHLKYRRLKRPIYPLDAFERGSVGK